MAKDSEAASKELREAWDDMIASLEGARDAIDQPGLGTGRTDHRLRAGPDRIARSPCATP